MSTSWTIDSELLITEVESRPLLYARSLIEYNNKTMKRNAWRDITKNLSQDWDTLSKEARISRCRDVQIRWKHLRDTFRRDIRTRNDVRAPPSRKKKKRGYIYYNELQFLLPHCKDSKISAVCVPSETSVPNRAPSPHHNISKTSRNCCSAINIENRQTRPSTTTSYASVTLKRKRKPRTSVKDEITKAINNEMLDEDKTFCLSLVPSLKKLNDDHKMIAKIEILNVIRNISKRSETNQSNQSTRDNDFTLRPAMPTDAPTIKLEFEEPIYTDTPDNMYQQHLQSGNIIYSDMSQSPSNQPALNKIILCQPSESHSAVPLTTVDPLKVYCKSPVQSPSSHSAKSFLTIYNQDVCQLPLKIESSSQSPVSSPVNNISSPEEYYLSSEG